MRICPHCGKEISDDADTLYTVEEVARKIGFPREDIYYTLRHWRVRTPLSASKARLIQARMQDFNITPDQVFINRYIRKQKQSSEEDCSSD